MSKLAEKALATQKRLEETVCNCLHAAVAHSHGKNRCFVKGCGCKRLCCRFCGHAEREHNQEVGCTEIVPSRHKNCMDQCHCTRYRGQKSS